MDKENMLNGVDDSCSKDLACKSFFSLNERFADLLNGSFYHGQQRIRAHELRELDTELGVQVKGNSLWRRRDLMKGHHQGSLVDLVGVEFQSSVDLMMPLRTMVYDALTYQRTYDLYNKVYPVKTMCLYTGDRKWNGPKSLHRMMEIEEERSEYVNDYPVCVVDLKEVDVQWFHNDEVRQLIQLFQLVNQTKNVEECVMKLKELNITSEDAVRTAGILAGTDLYERLLQEKEGGNFVACENIERIYNEIAEKKYPDIVAGRKRAELRANKAEEKANKAEEVASEERVKRSMAEDKANKAEEKANKAEKMVNETTAKFYVATKKLLQMGVNMQCVMEATGLSESELLALMEA